MWQSHVVIPAIVCVSWWWVWRSAAQEGSVASQGGGGAATARVPQPLLELYQRHTRGRGHPPPPADIIRALQPSAQGWIPGGTTLEFQLPTPEGGERLTAAQLRLHATPADGVPGAVSVWAWQGPRRLDGGRRWLGARPAWLSPLNVTAALPTDTFATSLALNLTLHGPLRLGEPPLLLLHYVPPEGAASHDQVDGARGSARRRRRHAEAEDYEEETNRVWSRDSGEARARQGRRARGGCRRRPLYVDFAELHYDSWILAPKGYEAFQCAGRCSWPLSGHLTPTKHALVQALMHSFRPAAAPRACCVPTRLLPISVIYEEPSGVVTFHYSYTDMVVAECGCR